MLFGRAREVQKLFQNLHQGIHTVTFGISGVGKTAILLEVESRLRAERTLTAVSCQARPIDDPIRIRRIFVDGRISMNSSG